MTAAILVIDLVQDTFSHDTPLARLAGEMLPGLNDFLKKARADGHRVIFSTDSFLQNDFIFQGRMKPHSIRGTSGAEIASGLDRQPEDVWLPKRRFSAFFKTDLDQTLRLWGIKTVAVAGVATQFCVLATAMDAVCHDFRAVILEDMSTSFSPRVHQAALDLYRGNVLDPIFRIMTGRKFLESEREEKDRGSL